MLGNGLQGTGRHGQPTPIGTYAFSGPFQKSTINGNHCNIGHHLIPRCILATRPDWTECAAIGTTPRFKRLAVTAIAQHRKQLFTHLQRLGLKPLPGRPHDAPPASDALRCRGVSHTPFLQRSLSSQKGALRLRLDTCTALSGAGITASSFSCSPGISGAPAGAGAPPSWIGTLLKIPPADTLIHCPPACRVTLAPASITILCPAPM